MSKPKDGISSPYGDFAQMASDALDRAHPGLPKPGKMGTPVQVVPPKKPEILNIDKPIEPSEKVISIENPSKPINIGKSTEDKEFDKDIKNELISLLIENKLSIVEVTSKKIIFEYKDTKMMFIPV